MKNLFTAAIFASVTFATSTFATNLDSGVAEFRGKVAKVCEVRKFRAGTVVIREGSNGNILSSKEGKPVTFVVRGNARNVSLHFGEPRIELNRNDGVSGYFTTNRKVTFDSVTSARKNNRVTASSTRKIDIAAVGTNDVTLHITIRDNVRASMLPAGVYRIFVPVTCTK